MEEILGIWGKVGIFGDMVVFGGRLVEDVEMSEAGKVVELCGDIEKEAFWGTSFFVGEY